MFPSCTQYSGAADASSNDAVLRLEYARSLAATVGTAWRVDASAGVESSS